MKNKLIEIAQGLCSQCGNMVQMRVVSRDEKVYAQKFCPRCEITSEALLSEDVNDFFERRSVVKPALIPNAFAGDDALPCPTGCGFCSRHEQHLCMPIVEISSRCNMRCPICINDSGDTQEADISKDEFKLILDKLLEAEDQIDILNISGGEPLLHPDLLALIDLALARREIVRVSISTNGLVLLENPKLLKALQKRDVVISLQFDGFDDEANRALRGRDMAEERRRILALLKRENANMSLVFTLTLWNQNSLVDAIELLYQYDNILSLMIQPIALTGRAENSEIQRITLERALNILNTLDTPVNGKDFSALPCSHPACFSLAYYLKLSPGRFIPLNRLIDEQTLLENAANKVVFGLNATEHEQLKDLVYRIWSDNGEDAEEICSVLKRLLKNYQASNCACKCFNPRKAFNLMEREIKSIFIHAFMDRGNFELSRARRCCQAYALRDGRLIPCCVRNNVGGLSK